MSGIIRGRYRGTLDKYIGDAIMAFWGTPVEDPQHARIGVLAALHMQKECEVLTAKFAARGWPALYAKRVADYRRVPPPAGWDGVTAFDEK